MTGDRKICEKYLLKNMFTELTNNFKFYKVFIEKIAIYMIIIITVTQILTWTLIKKKKNPD